MLRPARPVGEVDGELAGWLAGGGPVVCINLGTHVFFDERGVREMARGVKHLLDCTREIEMMGGEKGKGLRVLWKIPRGKEGSEEQGTGGLLFWKGSVVERVLGEEVASGVVRVVQWIEAEPTAVLGAGTVVCAVHHGGANSFLESVW
jgi:hypothetical protein